MEANGDTGLAFMKSTNDMFGPSVDTSSISFGKAVTFSDFALQQALQCIIFLIECKEMLENAATLAMLHGVTDVPPILLTADQEQRVCQEHYNAYQFILHIYNA